MSAQSSRTFVLHKARILEALYGSVHAHNYLVQHLPDTAPPSSSSLIDKSPKGSVDAPVVSLCRAVNSIDTLVTTSSCSGRITLFHSPPKETAQKRGKGGDWLLVEHARVSEAQVQAALRGATSGGVSLEDSSVGGSAFQDKPQRGGDSCGVDESDDVSLVSESDVLTSQMQSEMEGLISFRFEPFILAVDCRDLDSAQRLVRVAMQAGFRESGLVISTSGRFMVSVRSSLRTEAPVVDAGQLLVSSSYLRFLVQHTNAQFEANEERTAHFFDAVCREWQLDRARFEDGSEQIEQLEQERHLQVHAHLQRLAAQLADGVEQSAEEVLAAMAGDWTVHVSKRHTRAVKNALKTRKWLDRSRRIGPCGDQELAVPITADGVAQFHEYVVDRTGGDLPATCDGALIKAFLKLGDEVPDEAVRLHFPLVQPAEPATAAAAPVVKRKRGQNPHELLRESVAAVIAAHYADVAADGERLTALLDCIPRKWEKLGDAVLLPATAFEEPEWRQLFESQSSGEFAQALWRAVADSLRCERVARQAPVANEVMRRSQAAMLLGDDGWVKHRENGIWYRFDVTKSMFSSGNSTEKFRVGKLCRPGDVVVDLYAGIGYFTLPYLLHGRAAKVHACELNPHSVEALRRGVEANKVSSSRIEIYPGDNRDAGLHNVADRVNLGLLPSSEDGWPLAVRALKPGGGWLHVHGNVHQDDEQQWGERVRAEIERLACEQHEDPEKRAWGVRVNHIERVKWYAPKVRHLVVDIECVSGVAVVELDGDRTSSSVRRMPCPSAEEFSSSVSPLRVPVLLEDVPATPWTPESLQTSEDATTEVVVCVSDEQALDFVHRNFRQERMRFGELVGRVFAGASGLACSAQLPALTQNAQLPLVVDGQDVTSKVCTLSAGTRLWTHYETTDDLVCQVLGDCQVTLYPPEDVNNLYVSDRASPVVLRDDAQQVDEFPRLADASPCEVTLRPGDVLFIPALWFRSLRADTAAPSVSLLASSLAPFPPAQGEQAVQLANTARGIVADLPPASQEFYRLKSLGQLL